MNFQNEFPSFRTKTLVLSSMTHNLKCSTATVSVEMPARSALLIREEGGWRWDELEVRKSTVPGAGDGVFATKDIPPGLWIPITGTPMSLSRQVHTHVYHRAKQLGPIDGHPSLFPHRGVGSFGLALAMMVNESPDSLAAEFPVNCVYTLDFIETISPIAKGQELLVDYGPAYEPQRVAMGYTVNRPVDYEKHALDAHKKHRREYPPPSVEQRRGLLKPLDEFIAAASKHAAPDNPAQPAPQPAPQPEVGEGPNPNRRANTRPTMTIDIRPAMAVHTGIYKFEQYQYKGRRLFAGDQTLVNLYAAKQKIGHIYASVLVLALVLALVTAHVYSSLVA